MTSRNNDNDMGEHIAILGTPGPLRPSSDQLPDCTLWKGRVGSGSVRGAGVDSRFDMVRYFSARAVG